MSSNRRRARAARTLTGLLVLGMLGCQTTTPPTSPSGGGGGPTDPGAVAPIPEDAPPTADPAAIPSDATTVSQDLTVDVDPVHGAATARADRAVSTQTLSALLQVTVRFPSVTHDLKTGRTTVTMALQNTGAPLTYLQCQVTGDRRVISPAWPFNTGVAAANANQTVNLVFDNPSAGSFSIKLSFVGVLPHAGISPTSPGPTPPLAASGSVASSPTPTPSPSPTPVPVPAGGSSGGGGSYSGGGGYVPPPPEATPTPGPTATPTPTGTPTPHASPAATPTPAPTPTPTHAATPTPTPMPTATPTPTPTPTPAPTATPTPTPAPTATPTANPTATPTPQPTSSASTGSHELLRDFEQDAIGSDPSDFIDPNDEGYSYPWMPRVTWRVADNNGSRRYLHDGLSTTANLSFRRYRGTALGTQNGELPNHYFAELDVTPIQSDTYAPTGDQGTQVYYLDPTHYVEVLLKPNFFQVWECNNAPPFQSAGWSMLYQFSTNTDANQTRHLGAEVDCNTHTLKAYLDGQLMQTLNIDMVTTQTHYFSLRGTGNIVAHDNVHIKPLP